MITADPSPPFPQESRHRVRDDTPQSNQQPCPPCHSNLPYAVIPNPAARLRQTMVRNLLFRPVSGVSLRPARRTKNRSDNFAPSRGKLRGERSGSRVDDGRSRSVQFSYTMKKTHGHFHVVLRPEPEGGFTAIVPALPGCVTYGRTLTEAKKMAKDAIGGYIESLKKHKEPIPPLSRAKSVPSAAWLCAGSRLGQPFHLLPSRFQATGCSSPTQSGPPEGHSALAAQGSWFQPRRIDRVS